jgi:hypothetical protein
MKTHDTFDGAVDEICRLTELVVATPVFDTSEGIPLPRGEKRCFAVIGASRDGSEVLSFAFGLDGDVDDAKGKRNFVLNALAERDVAVINTDHVGTAACIANTLWPCPRSKEFYDIAVRAYGAAAMKDISDLVAKRLKVIMRVSDTGGNVVPLRKTAVH